MRLFSVMLLATCAACGCSAPSKGGLDMFRHTWQTAEMTENHADGKAIAEAHGKVLAAMLELKNTIGKNSDESSHDRAELASILLNMEIDPDRPPPLSFASPERLERDMSALLQEASDAPTWQIMQFRKSLVGRINPDGMDPVRRAILDNELRVRQDARRQIR